MLDKMSSVALKPGGQAALSAAGQLGASWGIALSSAAAFPRAPVRAHIHFSQQ